MIKKFAAVLTAAVLGVLLTGGTAVAHERQNFTLLSFNYGPTTVIANGAINAVGTEEFAAAMAANDLEEFGFETTFAFPAGTVDLTVDGVVDFSYNEVACLGLFSGVGGYEITGGTGDYEGATGSGTLTFRGNFVSDRDANGDCTFLDAFSYFNAQFRGDIDFEEGEAA